MNRLARLLTPLLFLWFVGAAVAQVSANYNLNWHVLSGGGGRTTSATYRVDDSLGLMIGGRAASASYAVDSGFWYGLSGAAGAVPATPTPTATPVVGVGADSYELDNTCGMAKEIASTGVLQTRNFHVVGDEDWIKFYGQSGKSYIIVLNNEGVDADAVIMVYSSCATAPVLQGFNAFGPTVQLQWSAPSTGWFYLRLMQNDPTVAGAATTNYDISVSMDYTAPAAPASIRIAAGNGALYVQWRKPPDTDVAGYLLQAGPDCLHPNYTDDSIVGADSTYYEIPGLINDTWYCVHIHAKDTSANNSLPSADTWGQPSDTADATIPALTLTRPTTGTVFTTSAANLSVGGVATDTGNNLSRARVRNVTNGAVLTNSLLTGGAYTFTVESVPLQVGDNTIQVTAYDLVGNNSTTQYMTIHRNPGLNGVVVIVGGHSESNSLQTNIDYATNRAYRMFTDAGFYTTSIRYLSPNPQDANGDGVSDVYAHTTPDAVHAALQWAAGQMGVGAPFFLYLMDHGLEDKYCADGCTAAGPVTAANLDAWLDELEAARPGSAVSVIIEACHSGSFIDSGGTGGVTQTISKSGRVVIVSTGVSNNAYASAQGAYFSDAFFSSGAEGSNLRDAFLAAKAAVLATGNNQTPWLDDNGDALVNASDGSVAATRYLATNFGTLLPHILAASLTQVTTTGTISATVDQGDEGIKTVWAAVYAPSFHEPAGTTLDLGVPLVQLLPSGDAPNAFSAAYDGFTEPGSYRIVIYAADNKGNQAIPKVLGETERKIYLPLIQRGAASAAQGSLPPQAGATATATATPVRTATATATPTTTATATATVAVTPTGTPAPVSTATVTPEPEPEPTGTPKPGPRWTPLPAFWWEWNGVR